MTSRTSPRSASWCASCARPSWLPSWADPGTICALVLALAACQRNQAVDVKNRHCQEAVADGRVTEARTWLADPATRGFEVDKSRLAAVTEGFYADGAPRVRAAWDEVDGTQVSALLVVELPADAAARRQLFARYTELASSLEGGHEAETDVGQRCLLVALE